MEGFLTHPTGSKINVRVFTRTTQPETGIHSLTTRIALPMLSRTHQERLRKAIKDSLAPEKKELSDPKLARAVAHIGLTRIPVETTVYVNDDRNPDGSFSIVQIETSQTASGKSHKEVRRLSDEINEIARKAHEKAIKRARQVISDRVTASVSRIGIEYG